MLDFCPTCEALLLITKIADQTSYKCRKCNYNRPINYIQDQIEFHNEIKENIILKEDSLKSMARTEKECDRCGHKEASFFEMQTRSADEPMTIFYQCISCKHTWKE